MMAVVELLRRVKRAPRLLAFRLRHRGKTRFRCPVCRYRGPFEDVAKPTGRRAHARCPGCGALERHRLQYLALERVLGEIDAGRASILHFAPEDFFERYFRRRFGRYASADLVAEGVDHQVDLQALPFSDGSYDFVFASHVLEHIQDDDRAIAEIRRVLRPGGIAVLPVPLVAERTVEYPEPNPAEFGHVRAPGLDYYDRFEPHFSRVERLSSRMFPEEHQVYIHEDRTVWPNDTAPLRPPMHGERHIDIVPVCYV